MATLKLANIEFLFDVIHPLLEAVGGDECLSKWVQRLEP